MGMERVGIRGDCCVACARWPLRVGAGACRPGTPACHQAWWAAECQGPNAHATALSGTGLQITDAQRLKGTLVEKAAGLEGKLADQRRRLQGTDNFTVQIIKVDWCPRCFERAFQMQSRDCAGMQVATLRVAGPGRDALPWCFGPHRAGAG